MDIMEAMRQRHAVRRYTEHIIEAPLLQRLQARTESVNQESGLHIQLCADAPDAFAGKMGSKFCNVRNYFALIGKKSGGTEEQIGFYGEQLVLEAAMCGLNTCWVAGSYRKKEVACSVQEGEKLYCVIPFGYGETNGTPHKSKTLQQVCKNADPAAMPDWFVKGVEAALLAPTALNQQRFVFSLDGTTVTAKALAGFYTKLDLGIVKYHFALGARGADWKWRD